MSLITRRQLILVALFASSFVLAGLAAQKSASRLASPAAGSTMTPVWSDEFDGPAGTPPDSTKWNHDTGGGGWGNNEWEVYTNSPNNAALDGQGHLVITARRPDPQSGCPAGPCDITSARLQTDGTFSTTYGRIEARIQVPAGQGLWPAFWMLSDDDSGEIDIMENSGHLPNLVSGTVHVPGHTSPDGVGAEYRLPGGASASSGFHVYQLDWAPTKLSWSVDGHIYKTLSPSDLGSTPWVFNRPFYMLLNLAVGGTDPGYPDASTPFPAQMLVDYVRIYKAQN